MVVLRSSSKGPTGSSSSNSKRLRSKDESDPSLGGSRRLRFSGVVPMRPEAKPIKGCTTKCRHDTVRPYATDAISAHNEASGTKYELVEPGFLTSVLLQPFILHHIDFTAKKTDVADAPEEMFFAELTTRNGVRCVKFCQSMGPKNLISGDKNYGCRYCVTNNVQHPSGGGFMTGRA
ncbi:hypothetical protein MKW92_031901 [Papaver armeniacum]|nr:hypothetical protein MKW92_031901 [Papaver armeniacum]